MPPRRGFTISRQTAKAAIARWTTAFCRNSARGPKPCISVEAIAGAAIAATQ